MDYRQAGVDVEAGRAFVQGIKSMVEKTYRPEVLGNFGGFSGCFAVPPGYEEPVLVSGTDGVGTKLKIAQSLDIHGSIGIDLVAMCVNDVLTSGAEPLFFLDYLATSQLQPEQLTQVVAGIAAGCEQAGCSLLGGETAEMPGFYQPGEYDLAGFCVGIVEKRQMLNGSQVNIGDRVIGLASSGVHSNGFSLVRKIVADQGLDWRDRQALLSGDDPAAQSTDADGQTLGEVFLTPTRIYVKPILEARRQGLAIHGMAHITGGGLPENLPRCLGAGQSIQINPTAWPVLPVFHWLATQGQVSPVDMFHTFNMGIGFAVIVAPDQVATTLDFFRQDQLAAYEIGEVIPGNGELIGIPLL